MKEPAPLPDDLLDYLAAEREPVVTPQATRERILARLGPFLPPIGGGGGGATGGADPNLGGLAPGTGSVASAAGAGAGAVAAWQGKLVVAVISALVGTVGGAAGHATLTTPRAVPVFVAQAMPVALVAPMEHAPADATAELAAETVPSGEATAPALASAGARAAPEERARPAASLRAERLLIETANAALLRGDHGSAIATLRRHAGSFPNGELAQEREVLLVQALRASGNDAAAAQRAKDFKRKFPGSLQQETVDKASPP